MAERPSSKLPRAPEYWDALAERIREDASQPLAAYAAAEEDWYGVLARRAAPLLAASAAAMLLLWLTLPAADSSVSHRWIERSVSPHEVAGTLFSGSEPPSIDALIVQFSPAGEGEGEP